MPTQPLTQSAAPRYVRYPLPLFGIPGYFTGWLRLRGLLSRRNIAHAVVDCRLLHVTAGDERLDNIGTGKVFVARVVLPPGVYI